MSVVFYHNLGLESGPIFRGQYKTIYNDMHGFIRLQKIYRDAFVNFSMGCKYESQGDMSGDVQEQTWKYQSALNYYIKAVELMPTFVEVYNQCGIICGKLELFDFAIKNFNEAIEWDPNVVSFHTNIAQCYLVKGNTS